MKEMKSIEELYKYLLTFDYGYWYDGKQYTGKNIEYNWDHYHTISPSNFVKHKVGNCWDFSEFEYLWIKENHPELNPQIWYIESIDSDGDRSTHTWVSYEEDDMTKVIEVAWGSQQGIHTYKSVDAMLDDYSKKHCEYHGGKSYVVFKIPPVKRYGLTPGVYMLKAWCGKRVRKVGKIPDYPTEYKT